MFLHLGGDFSVRVEEIISVLDYKYMNETETGKKFMTDMKEKIDNVAGEKIKSVVVTDDKIYLSKLSPATLKKRVGELRI
jgi:regulator of extracellular matrix RemA (YlzA/DUF370 family)